MTRIVTNVITWAMLVVAWPLLALVSWILIVVSIASPGAWE